jgi:hypothetical protein
MIDQKGREAPRTTASTTGGSKALRITFAIVVLVVDGK